MIEFYQIALNLGLVSLLTNIHVYPCFNSVCVCKEMHNNKSKTEQCNLMNRNATVHFADEVTRRKKAIKHFPSTFLQRHQTDMSLNVIVQYPLCAPAFTMDTWNITHWILVTKGNLCYMKCKYVSINWLLEPEGTLCALTGLRTPLLANTVCVQHPISPLSDLFLDHHHLHHPSQVEGKHPLCNIVIWPPSVLFVLNSA